MKAADRLTAIIEREENGFVALCPELDIASESASVEALTLFFETASPSEVFASFSRLNLYMTPTLQTAQRARFRSDRTLRFTESVIREMSRLATAHGAVNLAQGFPDFAAPAEIKQAACDAINADINQYPITWGHKPLRAAIAEKTRKWYGLEYDPEREVTVCCGATEGMIASLFAVTNPGDEVVVFEPYYESYWPNSLLCQIERKTVKLYPPDWTFDPAELRRAFSKRTKVVIVNSPNNPTGKVFSREELQAVANLCEEFDALALTDEIYEHILYDGAQHIPIATLPGMRERSVIVNAMSKTYAVTGWRVGWVLAPADLSTRFARCTIF